jgi:hypothetical protein
MQTTEIILFQTIGFYFRLADQKYFLKTIILILLPVIDFVPRITSWGIMYLKLQKKFYTSAVFQELQRKLV